MRSTLTKLPPTTKRDCRRRKQKRQGRWLAATGSANEYQLAEIFSNDTGNIRVQGLPYGTYLVVETTVPHDLFQAEPFIVTVDPEQDNNPWGRYGHSQGQRNDRL